MSWSLERRTFLGSAGAIAASVLLPALGAEAQSTAPIKLPPPIGRPERLARLAKARALMQQHGIGAILIEPGASLDYFTGVQWWRSERLTAARHPGRAATDHRHALLREALGRGEPRHPGRSAGLAGG